MQSTVLSQDRMVQFEILTVCPWSSGTGGSIHVEGVHLNLDVSAAAHIEAAPVSLSWRSDLAGYCQLAKDRGLPSCSNGLPCPREHDGHRAHSSIHMQHVHLQEGKHRLSTP